MIHKVAADVRLATGNEKLEVTEQLNDLEPFLHTHNFTFYHFEDMRDRADDSLRGLIIPPSKDGVLNATSTTEQEEIEIAVIKVAAAKRPAIAAEELEMKERLKTSCLGIKPRTFLPSLIFQ